MEPRSFIDTHVLIWLFSGNEEEFSLTAKKAIEEHELFISPMSLLEIDYLYEIGKIEKNSPHIFSDLNQRLGIEIADDFFYKITRQATKIHWTRDPFDRVIVSHSALHDLPLITRDKHIRKHYKKAIW